jgi:hydroxymethylglutaryl-CoA reductase
MKVSVLAAVVVTASLVGAGAGYQAGVSRVSVTAEIVCPTPPDTDGAKRAAEAAAMERFSKAPLNHVPGKVY